MKVHCEAIGFSDSCVFSGNTLYCNSLYGRKISAIRIPPQNETLFGERLAVISDSVIYGQMGIRAVSLNHVPHGHSACQINRGGCSHICVKLYVDFLLDYLCFAAVNLEYFIAYSPL